MEVTLSRVEAILQNILGADNVLVPPQSRVEEILLAILNNTEYIHPGDPSRVEEILLAIKDGGSYDKKALSRVEDILIHKLNDEEYTDYSEDDLSRVEKLLIQWIDLHPEVIKELTTSSFPISILANGLPLLDYRIYGNTVQSGRPTPDSPIEPEFVGELVTEGEYAGQYAIPISSAGQTKTIYLGQVPTTRKIKKLVLTGEEDWQKSSVGYNGFYFPDYIKPFTDMFCNIAVAGTKSEYAQRPWVTYNDRFLAISTDPEIVGTTVASFKSWLAERYANGNPVIVWAIGSSDIDIIGIVNEPLCKIGDYADSVDFSQAGVEIPTLKKPNTTVIDVETSLEPSSMYLKYTEPSDGPAPKTPALGTKDGEIYVTPNNEIYVLRR